MVQEAIALAASHLRELRSLVVLTGAGISVESGVPDFRSKEGWWRSIDPRTVATVEALENNYELFHAFYSERLKGLSDIHPHEGHRVLAKWELQGRVRMVATQNVDGLHQQAGSRVVKELHGSIRAFRCHRCGRSAAMEAFLSERSCGSCAGKLRPNVVLFGETLPQEAWSAALEAIEQADGVLVIGTSLQVYPVNQLPFLTKGKLLLINAEPTGEEHRFDVIVEGNAGEALQAIDEEVGRQ